MVTDMPNPLAAGNFVIALMSLLGLTAVAIKPTALALNILVAAIASWQFMRAGHFSGHPLWPVAAFAVPMPLRAVVGHRIGSMLGRHRLPPPAIKRLLAAVLTTAGAKLLLS